MPPLKNTPLNPAFARAGLVIGLALLGAVWAGGTVLALAPLRDPPEVVGVPLLTGYSEANEHAAFAVFLATTLVLAVLLVCLLPRSLPTWAAWIGAWGWFLPFVVPAWAVSPGQLPAATLVVGISYFLGAASRQFSFAPRIGAMLGWSVSIIISPDLSRAVLQSEYAAYWFGPGLIVAMLVIFNLLPSDKHAALERWAWLAASVYLLAGLASMAGAVEAGWLLAVNALLAVLGGAWVARPRGNNNAPPTLASWLGHPVWLVIVILHGVITQLERRWFDWSAWQMAAWAGYGAATALVLLAAWQAWQPRVHLGWFTPATISAMARHLPTRGWKKNNGGRGAWLLWGFALAAVTYQRPWFLFLLVLMSLGGWLRPRFYSRSWWPVFLTCGGIAWCILPSPPTQDTLDNFHDGQILSAVWEFESGRTLYAEVFPLRSFEFFVTWISRKIWEPTAANYIFVARSLRLLTVIGAALAAYAWTGSIAWSLATGLLMSCWELDARMGVPLLLAALVLRVHRQGGRWGWLALVAVSSIVGYAGFDMVPSYMVAVSTSFLIPRASALRARPWFTCLYTSIVALTLLLSMIAVFTLGLFFWQGKAAAWSYWWLLVDFSRHYSSFYGLPIPWQVSDYRRLLVLSLTAGGVWTVLGVLRWNDWPTWKRRAWVFLLAQYFFLVPRALGRSDVEHLLSNSGWVLLASLATFEGLRAARYLWRDSPLWRARGVFLARMVAATTIVLAAWVTTIGRVTPWQYLVYALATRSDTRLEPRVLQIVLKTVGRDQTVWEISNAMISYAHQRHNPTRHALAYCIGTPNEQRVALEALERNPPRLIAWENYGVDQIADPLRYYVLAPFLFEKYRPYMEGWLLTPAPAGWPGQWNLPPQFTGPLHLGRLPERWGITRSQKLRAGASANQVLPTFQTMLVESNTDNSKVHALVCHVELKPRQSNYLTFSFSVTPEDVPPGTWVSAELLFSPTDRPWEKDARVTWDVLADGTLHSYMIPIGCSPAWSWRPGVDRLMIRTNNPGVHLHIRDGHCWFWRDRAE